MAGNKVVQAAPDDNSYGTFTPDNFKKDDDGVCKFDLGTNFVCPLLAPGGTPADQDCRYSLVAQKIGDNTIKFNFGFGDRLALKN